LFETYGSAPEKPLPLDPGSGTGIFVRESYIFLAFVIVFYRFLPSC
jgi:hypothetical protein